MIRTRASAAWLTALLCIAAAGAGCSAADAAGDVGPTDDGSVSSAAGGSSGSGGKTGGAGGRTSGGGNTGATSGGSSSSGGTVAGGASGSGGSLGTGGAAAGCDAAGLVWKTGSKTNYTSYPDPGSEECIKYSGCLYEGLFAACPDKEPVAWVQAHNIVAAFPDFGTLKLHDLCLKSGSSTILVTVLDTCGDSDCGGCCTQNKGSADELIDVESFTDTRWGVEDGPIQWADLGPTKGQGCK
jgi:hypothetical protein